MATATYRFQAWKHVRAYVWFVVGVVLVVGVMSRLSWHDYAELRDGRQGRVLAVSVASHTVTVQLDGVPVQVAAGAIAVLKPGVRNLLRQANGQFLLGAILLACPIPFLCAVRVRLLLHGLDVSISGARIVAVCLLGQVVNATALGSAGGDLYRAVALCQDRENWHRTLAGLIADRVIGVVVLVTLTAFGACWYMQHPILGALAQWTVGVWLSGVVMVLLGFWVHFHQWLEHWERKRLGHRWETKWALLRDISQVLHNRTVLVKVLWLSVAVQVLNLGAMTCIGYAFGFDYALEASVLVMPLAALLSVVIPTPQGLGVLEGMLVVVLASTASGGANMCLLFALGVRLLRLVWALPGVVLLGTKYRLCTPSKAVMR